MSGTTASSASLIFTPVGYQFGSSAAWIVSPVVVVVAEIRTIQ
jgi:hypothetical protein